MSTEKRLDRWTEVGIINEHPVKKYVLLRGGINEHPMIKTMYS